MFGIRGGTENRNLRWGDLQLKKTDSGREYIEFNERITKTRTAEKQTETRAFPPKQFSHEDTGSCPVYAYKEYARHRPLNMLAPESPFYLAINRLRRSGSECWFKSQPMGEHNIRGLMKTMAEKAGLQGRKTNHSARKTTCTKLLHSGIAPTVIQQLTGHKNVQSINNYARASLQMQEQMSDILSDNYNPAPRALQTTSTPTSINASLVPQILQPVASTVNHASLAFNTHSQMSEKNSCQFDQLFPRSTLVNCNITINNKIANSPVTKRRRVRVIDSDSD